MLCIYHIADHDGKGSAAIVKSVYPETELLGLNHDMEIPYDEILKHYKYTEENELFANIGTNAIPSKVLANKLASAYQKQIKAESEIISAPTGITITAPTEKQVFVKDMLFATLETSTRRIKLLNNHEFLITDTVGFVNKLPHHLVESFKSTLEEITEASLIVHLIDTSSPYVDWQIETTIEVLDKLHCSKIPCVYVFNKTDLVTNEIFIPTSYTPSLRISNKTNKGIKELIEYIESSLFPDEINTTLLIPYTNGEVCNVLMEKANVLDTEYLDSGTKIKVILSKHLYELYKKYEKRT